MIQINLFTKEQQIHRLSKWTCVSRREEWGERGLFYTPSHIRATCYFLPSEWNFSPSLELAPFQITKTYLALTIYFVFITSQYYRACHSILPSCVCVCVCVCVSMSVSLCVLGGKRVIALLILNLSNVIFEGLQKICFFIISLPSEQWLCWVIPNDRDWLAHIPLKKSEYLKVLPNIGFKIIVL